MKTTDRFSFNQLLALCSVSALTPALRLLPSASAKLAGRGGWLSVLLALPAAAAYGYLLWCFSRRRREGESLPALWQRAAGARTGALLLALCALWLLFYAAFTLRAGAERLITTVYPNADRLLFILPMGLLATVAGAGQALRLTRMAKLVLPLLVGAILLTLLFALRDIRTENLLPLSGQDALPVLRGALPTLDVAALILVLLFFLSDSLTGEARYRSVLARITLLGFLVALLVAVTIGCFGHELCALLTRPYFSLVRNLVFFRSLERIEALIVTLWLFSDFLLVSTLLLIAHRALEPLLGAAAWIAPGCGVLVTLLACLLAPDAAAYAQLSTRLVPSLNAAVCLLLIPGVYALGRLRHRI